MAVTPAMLAVALGLAAPETGSITEQQWALWIDDANMLIDLRMEKLAVEGPLDVAKRDYVVREAVVAHIRKPDDATDVTISVDDATSIRRYQSGKGRVTILDEWWSILGLVEPSTGAFALDMVPRAGLHMPWCSLYFGGTVCSCGVALAGGPIYEPPDAAI